MPASIPAPPPPLPWRYRMLRQDKARRAFLLAMALALGLYAFLAVILGAQWHYGLTEERAMPWLWAAMPLGLGLLALLRRAVLLSRTEAKTLVKEVSWDRRPPEFWFVLNGRLGLEIAPLAGPDGIPPPVAPSAPRPASAAARPYFLASGLLFAISIAGLLGQAAFKESSDLLSAALALVYLAWAAAHFRGIALDADQSPPSFYSGHFGRLLPFFLLFFLFLIPAPFIPEPAPFMPLGIGLIVLAWARILAQGGLGALSAPLPESLMAGAQAWPRARPYMRAAGASAMFSVVALLNLMPAHFLQWGEGFFAAMLLLFSAAGALAWGRGIYLDAADKGCPARASLYLAAGYASMFLYLPLLLIPSLFPHGPLSEQATLALAPILVLISAIPTHRGHHLAEAGGKAGPEAPPRTDRLSHLPLFLGSAAFAGLGACLSGLIPQPWQNLAAGAAALLLLAAALAKGLAKNQEEKDKGSPTRVRLALSAAEVLSLVAVPLFLLSFLRLIPRPWRTPSLWLGGILLLALAAALALGRQPPAKSEPTA